MQPSHSKMTTFFLYFFPIMFRIEKKARLSENFFDFHYLKKMHGNLTRTELDLIMRNIFKYRENVFTYVKEHYASILV